MDNDTDDIDEVALNALLAEGIDLPTAWEASRRNPIADAPENISRAATWIGLLAAIVAAAMVAILFVF